MISVDVGKINLKHILESGQCFRWTQKTDNIFNFVIGNNNIECQIDNKGLLMVESNSDIREIDVKNYFDTSTDYSFIKDCADKNDEYLQNAIQKYGSEEYTNYLQEMNGALQHHYANYRHHPEHFDKGINDMNLVDLVEMFCDWKASSMRHIDGNLLKSIDINASRFNMSSQLKQIFINTAKMYDEQL